MADEQNVEDKRNEKINAASRDFEQFFDEIKEKNKDYKYKEGLNFDNLEEVRIFACNCNFYNFFRTFVHNLMITYFF